ncbi:MAG: NYN domain-containing protein [Candidatus Omnitrophota bacterium]
MSLEYIVDGYNVAKHALVAPYLSKNKKDCRIALLDFIREMRLSGSPRNEVRVVFDGYPGEDGFLADITGIKAIFSKGESADEVIRRLAEGSGNPKRLVVVSDDKEVRFFARAAKAGILGVEEFVNRRKTGVTNKGHPRQRNSPKDLEKDELNYSQAERINEELKNIWLK